MTEEMNDSGDTLQQVRDEALEDAVKVCDIWAATQAVPEKSTDPRMALIIASVTRVTAEKIRSQIRCLLGKPGERIWEKSNKEPQWVLTHCECGWGDGNPGCPQGKFDGNCAVWVKK